MIRKTTTEKPYTPIITACVAFLTLACDAPPPSPDPTPTPPSSPEPLSLTLTRSGLLLDGHDIDATATTLADTLQRRLVALPPSSRTLLTVHPEVPYQVFAITWTTLHRAQRTPVQLTAPSRRKTVENRPSDVIASPSRHNTHTTARETSPETQPRDNAPYPIPDVTTEGWGVGLSVGVGRRGALVAMNGAALPPLPGCPSPGPTVCRDAQGALDLRRLTNLLLRVHARYPQTQRVTLVAEPTIPFGQVARIRALLRHRPRSPHPDGLFATRDELEDALAAPPQAPLFTEIVFGALE